MKRLNELLPVSFDTEVLGITDDSRLVQDGYIFVATEGYFVDHYDYISDAIDKGCCFVVCDREIEKDFPHIIVENIHDSYIDLCKKYYDICFDDFHFIGITGTDGKTTTATIVKELIHDCAYIGTNGLIIHDKCYSISNTTPCIFELCKCLSIIKDADISNVVMEVSSEALLHHRIDGIVFDIIAFTNITGDHLNIHNGFDNYVKSKLQLLNYINQDSKVIVNYDDINLHQISTSNMVTFGKNVSNYRIVDIQYTNTCTMFSITHDNDIYLVTSPLFGEYNIYNMTEAFLISYMFGISSDILLDKVKKISPIPGRGERLNFGQDYLIVLDYAHTINGVKSILEAYREFDDVIVVTGAAGGRDTSKRPIIGKMVMDIANMVIFTMDDPRYESVDDIIDQIVGDRKDYVRIIDRKEAIGYALDHASSDSVVLIIGKGRDKYMAIEDKKVPYSDYDVICEYFELNS